ncbi:kinase-like domain-containing protein [Dipodascopsis uninucleata]
MMETGGYNLLVRFIESQHFSLFLCISYLARYADNVGVHFYLCKKLRTFPYQEIEFFLPQLCQIILTVPTESVALEDFLIEMCNKSTHSAVLTFWLLQAHLEDLSHDPEARSFQICRRIYNKVQYILFGIGEPPNTKIRENPGPALVLGSAIMGAIAVPLLPEFVGPITIAQARKPRLRVFHLAPKLNRSKSSSRSLRSVVSPRRSREQKEEALDTNKLTRIETDNVRHNMEYDEDEGEETETGSFSAKDYDDIPLADEYTPLNGNGSVSASPTRSSQGDTHKLANGSGLYGLDSAGISSLPDLRPHRMHSPMQSASMSSTEIYTQKPIHHPYIRSHHVHPIQTTSLTPSAKVRMLKSNYFRYETAFAYALQAISTRLRLVPKPARLSALRAEITLLNNALPAEVDIPMILDSDTYRANPTQHKIVRIAPTEAQILNSAERVPFLLMIEILRDEVTFDPSTPRNMSILNNPTDYRNLFDIAYAPSPRKPMTPNTLSEDQNDGSEMAESEMGDISSAPLADLSNSNEITTSSVTTSSSQIGSVPAIASGFDSVSSSPRNSDLTFSSQYPSGRQFPIPRNISELNDLAVHMRTAATMLAQLDYAQGVNGSLKKLPKEEIQQIKSRIITSMQHLEEESMFTDVELPQSLSTGSKRPAVNREAGQRRLENDLKTGAIKGNTATIGFGEEWADKKERIRKTSPYGHLPNWDLLSVIAKTGSDLRQEAFACQLILAIKRIWEDADVDVWVRRMTILVTGAGSGLVETITNGISIHSLKKALATSLLGESENNHKGHVASLTDYFYRVFGERGTQRFKIAQAEFIKSLVAYSLICYILQIKDRHNGNILLDTEGHVVHIDFGFLLSNTPGSVGFEAAPFKLTHEYVDLMDGPNSPAFDTFRALMKIAFKVLRKKVDDVVVLVEMMQKESPLPCFSNGEATAQLLRQRFQLHMSEAEVDNFVDHVLINKSMGSIYTRLYDQYQFVTQGIYS